MKLFPAIDLYDGRAVRLMRGEYDKMTVYSDNPPAQARIFKEAGAEYLHVVDLEGARDGGTPNFEAVVTLIRESELGVEVGGGIRDRETAQKYCEAGAMRVILGTAAAASPELVRELVRDYGDRIAVGVDIRDGFVAVKGWTELTEHRVYDFCASMQDIGVRTIICTDISKDGLLSGTNLPLYSELSSRLSLDLIASGGVSTLEDVRAVRDMGLYGCILGRALYTGGINLAAAVELCKNS